MLESRDLGVEKVSPRGGWCSVDSRRDVGALTIDEGRKRGGGLCHTIGTVITGGE